jgi:hypothetical protein
MVQNSNLGDTGIHTDSIVISKTTSFFSFYVEKKTNTYICFAWVSTEKKLIIWNIIIILFEWPEQEDEMGDAWILCVRDTKWNDKRLLENMKEMITLEI